MVQVTIAFIFSFQLNGATHIDKPMRGRHYSVVIKYHLIHDVSGRSINPHWKLKICSPTKSTYHRKTCILYRKQNTHYLQCPFIDYSVIMPLLAHNSISSFRNLTAFVLQETYDSYLTRNLDIYAKAASPHGSVWQCFIEGSPVMSFCDIQPFSCGLEYIPDPHSSMAAVKRYPLSEKKKKATWLTVGPWEIRKYFFKCIFLQIVLRNV